MTHAEWLAEQREIQRFNAVASNYAKACAVFHRLHRLQQAMKYYVYGRKVTHIKETEQ